MIDNRHSRRECHCTR